MKRFLCLVSILGFTLWTSLVYAAPIVSLVVKDTAGNDTFLVTPVPITGSITLGAAADVTLADTIYEITLTDTATVDSSIVLPAKCTGFELWGQTSTHTIRWMLTSGTYAVQPPGTPYNTFDKGISALYSGRLYLKDTTEAGAKVTVIIWTKP